MTSWSDDLQMLLVFSCHQQLSVGSSLAWHHSHLWVPLSKISVTCPLKSRQCDGGSLLSSHDAHDVVRLELQQHVLPDCQYIYIRERERGGRELTCPIRPHYVAKATLKLVAFHLPQPYKCQNYRFKHQCPVNSNILTV